VAHGLPAGIEPAILVLVVDPLDLQLRDALGDLRRQLPREVDEITARELALERLRRGLEQARER
jgi:hypothetical protein